jgi:hypothetical protein
VDHQSIKSGSDGNGQEIKIAQPMKLNTKRNVIRKTLGVKDAAASAVNVTTIMN